MSDKPVTVWNPQMVAELSEGYKTWAFGDTGQDFLPAMEEVQRLCEVIVGLRSELATVRKISRDMIAAADWALGPGVVQELERLRAELRRAKGYPENPCTGAEFVAAMQAVGEPLSDEAFAEVMEELRDGSGSDAAQAAQPSGEGTDDEPHI